MPVRPWRRFDRVERLTSRAFAALVTLKPRGSKHSFLRTSPGCGGLCIRRLFMFLMVVFVINVRDIFTFESKCDAPVATDSHGPSTFAIARQCMQVEPWQSHVSRMHRDIQTAYDQPQAFCMLRLNSRFDSFAKELFQAFVLETENHSLSITQSWSDRWLSHQKFPPVSVVLSA